MATVDGRIQSHFPHDMLDHVPRIDAFLRLSLDHVFVRRRDLEPERSFQEDFHHFISGLRGDGSDRAISRCMGIRKQAEGPGIRISLFHDEDMANPRAEIKDPDAHLLGPLPGDLLILRKVVADRRAEMMAQEHPDLWRDPTPRPVLPPPRKF